MTIQRYTGENVEFHTTDDLVAYEDYAELKEEYERLDKSHSAALAKIDELQAGTLVVTLPKPKHVFPSGTEAYTLREVLTILDRHGIKTVESK